MREIDTRRPSERLLPWGFVLVAVALVVRWFLAAGEPDRDGVDGDVAAPRSAATRAATASGGSA